MVKMTTFIRIKRKASDSPNDILVFSSKKAKTSDSAEGCSSQGLLYFAGTSEKEVDDETFYKQKADSISFKTRFKSTKKYLEKLDKRYKSVEDRRLASRFKLVSQKRNYNQSDELKIYDVINIDHDTVDCGRLSSESKKPSLLNEGAITCNGQVLKEIENPENDSYVFDIYYHNDGDFDDMMLNDVFSLYPVESDQYLYEPDSEDDKDAYVDDDDDSNDEDNWRNNYPDSDGPFNSDIEVTDEDDFGMSRLKFAEDDDSNGTFNGTHDSDSESESAYENYLRRVKNEPI